LSHISKILGQFLVFQKIVFSLKNKRFHKFVMAYSESSHQMQQNKKKKKKNCATRIYRWEHLTGTKSEKLNFYFSNIHNSPLVPVLIRTIFSHLVPIHRPQEIKEKNQKIFFLGIYTGPNTLFLELKIWSYIWYLVLPSKFFFKT
jgi:hypothetical protein